MLTRQEIIKNISKNNEKIQEYGVKNIGIFGSFAKSAQKDRSDVDILVEFEKGEKTFDNYMNLKLFIQKLLRRKVDLVIKEALKSRIKSHILKEVKYARL